MKHLLLASVLFCSTAFANQNPPVNLPSPSNEAARVSTGTMLELSIVEGKSTSLYKIPAPKDNKPSRFTSHNNGSEVVIEFFWAKEKSVLQYDIERVSKDQNMSSSFHLVGGVQVPASGKVSLVEATGLSVNLSLQ
jgi:hypothetical protein